MTKHELGAAVLPLLGGSIAIAHGGSDFAYSLIAILPLLSEIRLSPQLAVWAIDAFLGAALFLTGFAMLMKSNRGRIVMLGTLTASVLYELFRTSMFLPSTAAQSSDKSPDFIALAILLVAILLALAPSSVRYTASDSKRGAREVPRG